MTSLTQGQSALKRGDWESARHCFTEVLQSSRDPIAHDGLGIALWWLNEIEASHRHRAEAFVGFKQQGELRRAGRIAAWLAREQLFFQNNSGAMQGWFARAERVLADTPPCPEKAWVALYRASLLATPHELASCNAEIIENAHRTNESDLEALALAFRGIALVGLTEVSAGVAALDEAMTMATGGEVSDLMVVSEIFCLMLSACEQLGDTVRSEQWYRAADLFARRYQCAFLSAYCRTAYGSLLTASGQWAAAEETLQAAIALFHRGHQGLKVHALLKLAQLRLLQGKLEEAELLLRGYEDYHAALFPLAQLYWAQQNPALAQATLERALPPTPTPTLDRLPLLFFMIDILLERGDVATAQQYGQQAVALVAPTNSDLLWAQVELAQGRIERAMGGAGAQVRFQAALQRLQSLEQSLVAGRTRLEMARLLQQSDRVGAIAWARAALATFERIGATHESNEVGALLRTLGIQPRPKTRSLEILTEREKEVFALLKQGLSNREIAHRLVISPKTVEHHVGQILSKLGLNNRAEVAAYALMEEGNDK
jgi:ATP/maltotriose-dependent transcriptional regulator MalT